MSQLFTAHSVEQFALYFTTGMVLFFLFSGVYIWLTPYDDEKDIAAGKMAPAIAWVGAMLGFVLPMVTAMYYGGSYWGFAAWATFAGVVQLTVFSLMYWRMHGIESDNKATALIFFGASLCIGLINAAAMVP